VLEPDTQENHVNRSLILRRTAPFAAALAIGGGVGAGVYAGLSGGGSTATSTVTAVVPAQPAATTQTTSTLTALYDKAAPGVVDIRVTSSSPDNGFGQPGGQSSAEGSGFVVDTSGDIVTNQHVVDGATSVTVRFSNGKTAKATVVGTDPSTDIAVVKVNVAASQLHPLAFGSSSSVDVGQEVAAIGSPFGLTGTMTAGIISALNRTIQAPNNYSIAGAIQTDAPINHGNSGGPLLDLSGNVIGVNAQIESDSGDNAGVGFAIPSDAVKSVVRTLIAGGTVQHAYLGVHIGDAASGAGAEVGSVASGSPADKAGLQAGDVVTAFGGKTITDSDDLTAAVSAHQPGDKVSVTIERNGKTQTLDLTLGVRPS
jgi:putative serine protease PepD